MNATSIDWRPLGELFMEAGLVSKDELEEALAEQAETRRRLGEILLSRGLISSPELTRVLLDQLGRELQKEGESGARTIDLAARRALRTPKPGTASAEAPEQTPVPAASEPILAPVPVAEPVAATVPPPPPPQPQADLAPAQIETDEPALLLRQVDELRELLARETAGHQSALVETTRALEARMSELERMLEQERASHRRALAELDRGRAEAGAQAAELRSSLARLRAELGNVEATMTWFELWATSPLPESPPATRA